MYIRYMTYIHFDMFRHDSAIFREYIARTGTKHVMRENVEVIIKSCTYMCIYIYTHTHLYIYTHIYAYTHTYTHTHTHIYIYITSTFSWYVKRKYWFKIHEVSNFNIKCLFILYFSFYCVKSLMVCSVFGSHKIKLCFRSDGAYYSKTNIFTDGEKLNILWNIYLYVAEIKIFVADKVRGGVRGRAHEILFSVLSLSTPPGLFIRQSQIHFSCYPQG